MAIKYGNLNANNINLGWINSSSLSNDINKILNEMKIGEVSSPIIKQNSIIFLKINDTRKSNVKKDNLIKIKNNIINQEKNEQFKLYSKSHLSKLRSSVLLNTSEKKIIIISGDPNSINSEIIFKCWKKLNNSEKKKFI